MAEQPPPSSSDCYYKNGEIIREIEARFIVPLFVLEEKVAAVIPSSEDIPVALFRKILTLDHHEEECFAILTGLYLVVMNRVHRDEGFLKELSANDDSFPLRRLVGTAYALLLREYSPIPQLSLNTFESIVQWCFRYEHIVYAEHPIHKYLRRQQPDAWEVVARRFVAVSSSSVVALRKQLIEAYPDQPYAVLVSDKIPPQSCLPTGILELNRGEADDSRLVLTALVDHHQERTTVRCIPDHADWEVRSQRMEQRTGTSCYCLRCRYEANENLGMDSNQLLRLAHFYMGQQQEQDIKRAEGLMKRVLETKPSSLEAYHALGAIALSKGNFLAAQRIWQSAPRTSTLHAGLDLQWAKLKAYRYLEKDVRQKKESPRADVPLSREIVPQQAFVGQIVDATTCQRILEWVNALDSAEWTSNRHYAVPTRDVPVHSVPPLLNWFVEWMDTCMIPLLASQFGTSLNYYVHDAFCVCYDAGKSSNYLPIHVDESTHSFVVALNQDYVGGGTYFSKTDSTVLLRTGEVLCFRGNILEHGGEPVTSGKRYILTGFLYLDNGCNSNDEERDEELLMPGSTSGVKRKSTALEEARAGGVGFSFDFLGTGQ